MVTRRFLFAASLWLWSSLPGLAQEPAPSELDELERVLRERMQEGTERGAASPEALPRPNAPGPSVTIAPAPATPSGSSGAAAPSEEGPPYLGLSVERATDGRAGLRVVEIASLSPAWKAGFKIGDQIVAVAGQSIATIDDFAAMMATTAVREPIKFLVARGGRNVELTALLMPRELAMKVQPPSSMPPRRPVVAPRDLRSVGGEAAAPRAPRPPAGLSGPERFGFQLASLSPSFRSQFGIPAFRGASVLEVIAESPAYLAGLKAGDCIVDFNGQRIDTDVDLIQRLESLAADELVPLTFYRGPQLLQTDFQLESQPSPVEMTLPVERQVQPLGDAVSPDMLTPAYVRQLQQQIRDLQAEVARLRRAQP